jgi:hypothetical protein
MEKFDNLMFEALDDTLRLVLGENASEFIQSIVESQPSPKMEVGKNVETTMSYLEKLIGKEGAQIIQATSIKRLCFKIKEEYEDVEAHFLVLDELYDMKFKLLSPLLNKKKMSPN